MARGEFETIAALFAPLTRGHAGALGLKDDAACLRPRAGHDLVITADALVAGVHFFANDKPADIAAKALRTNLSDLAAKGATPIGYFMALVRPRDFDDRMMQRFAKGLARDGKLFSIPLLGGDTTSTPGPLTIAITALGEVRHGRMLRRDGARPGDDIWVSGNIGDGALGLLAAQGKIRGRHAAPLLRRYRRPEPRLALGRALVGLANACMDISDGLIGDLGHLVRASKVGAQIEALSVPLSAAARRVIGKDAALFSTALTGGDDYELLFTADPQRRATILRAAGRAGVQITRIGFCTDKTAKIRVCDAAGRRLYFKRAGFTHF